MDSDNTAKALSESEQMYLLTIATLNETGQDSPIPVSQIAKALDVIPVSVHQMIQKLARKEYLKYEPYKGVSLTQLGAKIAYQVLRSRRLWAVFLVEKLKLSPIVADELACHFEHFTSAELCNRLAAFLENPPRDPLGKPIPEGKITSLSNVGVQLSNLKIGEQATILEVPEEESTRSFLQNEGIIPGSKVSLQGIGNNNELLLMTRNQHVYLSAEIASRILIRQQNPLSSKGKKKHHG